MVSSYGLDMCVVNFQSIESIYISPPYMPPYCKRDGLLKVTLLRRLADAADGNLTVTPDSLNLCADCRFQWNLL